MNSQLVSVSGCPHPFRPTRFDEALPSGLTLEEIVARGLDRMSVPASLRGNGHAYVGEKYVPRNQWASTVPGPGEFVTYRVVPQNGGGDKGVMRIILTVIVIAVAALSQQYYLANFATYTAAGALTTGSAMMGAGIAAGLTAAGMLAINALVPVRPPSLPSSTSEKESSTYSISGARNTISPFGTIPLLLGRHRIVPPQGAFPYTEVAKDDQYVRQLFVLGYRGLAFTGEFKIGEASLSKFEEIQVDIQSNTTAATKPKYYSSDISEQSLSVELKQSEGWQVRATDQECDEFSFDISCPQGLVEFADDGDKITRIVKINAQYKSTASPTWIDITGTFPIPERSWELRSTRARVREDDGDGYHYVTVTKRYTVRVVIATGEVEFVTGDANYTAEHFGIASFDWNSDWSDIQNIAYHYPAGSTGFGLEYMGDDDDYVVMNEGTLPYGDYVISGKQTSAIRRTFKVTPGTSGVYEVRLARITDDSTDDKVFDQTWWSTLRAVRHVTPVRCKNPLVTVSLRARATGQLNGAVDEFNVEAVSQCYDYDKATGTWIWRATSNPASLFRCVLQHPANEKRVANSQLDLVKLAEWHEFCRVNGFEYNRYHDFTGSVYSVLQDIAAAGRASVTRPDGKWSVIIDKARTTLVQHFSPRNSWGFRFTKKLPRLPHAWRVRFINDEQGYQSDERIVYADGYNASNATEFEALELPGVTQPDQVWKLARYHYACAKLRPEEYEFYADMEHIVCTRGDLIRVTHDVPLWGGASGRVKSVDGQVVTVDEPCWMVSGREYVIRFRTQSGATIIRNVVWAFGEQTVLALLGTGAVPAAGDLFLFGELGQESTELIVKGIEPGDNLTARIIAVDHSPAIYSAGSGAIPAFDTNVSRPYKVAIQKPEKPTVGAVRSDERVLLRNPDGSLTSRVQISFSLPSSYDTGNYWVQLHYREVGAETWEVAPPVRTDSPFIYISPATDRQAYEFRLRTAKDTGVASDWTATLTHTTVGKTTPPPAPLVMYATAAKTGVMLDWDNVPVLDLSHYVVRKGETWDTGTRIYQGKASAYLHGFLPAGTHKFWVKAVDVVGNNSLAATGATLVVTAPGGVGVTYGNEADYIRLHWGEPSSMFPIVNYDVRIGDTWATSTRLAVVKSTEHKVIGPAVGDYRFWVAAIDAAGNAGATDSVEVSVTACSAVSIRAQIIDNNVLLSWTQATGGTFPPKEYEVRKGSTWDDAEVVGTVAARFSAIFETKSGTYTYWVAAVDRAGNVGDPASRVATVNEPPDYVLRSDIDSTFTGTKTNAFLEGGQLYAPVNTTETWTEHFTSNSWTTPQDQINAGFDDYVEPTPTSARYVEDFNYGGVLSGTRITVTPNWVNVRGSSTLSCQIFTKKLVGDSWTAQAAGFSVFATAFQYVRVQIDVTPNGGQDDLVKISRINVNLSLKTKSDGGKVACSSGHVGGTVVPFNVSFVDIHSLTVTPKVGGTAVYGLYDFDDAPNPTSFKILLYNAAGTRVSGEASWSAKGA